MDHLLVLLDLTSVIQALIALSEGSVKVPADDHVNRSNCA